MAEKLDIVASQLLLPEAKRIELMMMVKEGKISPERAMERAVALNKKLADEVAREEREKQQSLLRMSAKARAQEAAKNRIKAKEDAIKKQEEEQNRVKLRPSSYISPPAQVAQIGMHTTQRSSSDASAISATSPTPTEEHGTDDTDTAGGAGPAVLLHHVSAHDMRMSEADRIEVMRLVKSGELSVNEAVARVLLLERNLQAKEKQEPIIGGKQVLFNSDGPLLLETWSKHEYDRSPSNDYDPEYARRQWETEEEEEKERQLDDRWTYLERSLPPGVQCEERIQYGIKKRKIAEMEALAEQQDRDRRAAARLQLQQTRALRAQERAAVAAAKAEHSAAGGLLKDPTGASRVAEAERRQKLSESLDREVMTLESNMAAIRSVLATFERRRIQQHVLLVHEIARLEGFQAEIRDVLEELDECDHADDVFEPCDPDAWKKEIEKIRADARRCAAERLSQSTEESGQENGGERQETGDGASCGEAADSTVVDFPIEGTLLESETDSFDPVFSGGGGSARSVGLAAMRSSVDLGPRDGTTTRHSDASEGAMDAFEGASDGGTESTT
eukprot:m.731996 g.731996  ORF g.731996 m.731996 type:complete len:561 (-) comp23066_c0_seq1:368-2050(-)